MARADVIVVIAPRQIRHLQAARHKASLVLAKTFHGSGELQLVGSSPKPVNFVIVDHRLRMPVRLQSLACDAAPLQAFQLALDAIAKAFALRSVGSALQRRAEASSSGIEQIADALIDQLRQASKRGHDHRTEKAESR